MHLTEAGTGLAVVLLHWVPLSGRLYDAELSTLADAGVKGVAVDLMGFGRSARHDGVWSFAEHAAALKAGLKAAGICEFALLGAHFSAPVALELAVDPDLGVSALALDGCAHLLPPAAMQAIGAKTAQLKGPGLQPDGSHRTFLWDQAINAYQIFDPDFVLNEASLPLIYRFLLDYLSTGPAADFGGFAPYPITERLAQVRCPLLVLTAEKDPLRAAYEPTLAAAGPRAVGRVLPGAHPLHDAGRQGEYSQALVEFLRDHA